ncbi:MAG: hypothetical protein RLZZ200_1989 [Pseudomonadota bacterium]|jgi:uncharacterized membrane protein YgdD (TMEM256/DUF423 family)
MNGTRVLGIAGLLIAGGIVVGALASHALQKVLEPRQLASLHTAVNYQLFNALGLLAIGVLMRSDDLPALKTVAGLLVAGIVCFSGGIYLMLAGAPRFLGFVTPLGGLLLLAAWGWFAITQLRR